MASPNTIRARYDRLVGSDPRHPYHPAIGYVFSYADAHPLDPVLASLAIVARPTLLDSASPWNTLADRLLQPAWVERWVRDAAPAIVGTHWLQFVCICAMMPDPQHRWDALRQRAQALAGSAEGQRLLDLSGIRDP